MLIGRCWAVFPALLTVLRCAALAPAAFLVPTLWTVDGGWILIQLPALALAVALGLVLTGEVRTAELSGLYARCSSGRRRAKQANETA